jgi:hypothetical protein
MANGTHITLPHLGQIPRALQQSPLFRHLPPNLAIQSLFIDIFRLLLVMSVDSLAHWYSLET